MNYKQLNTNVHNFKYKPSHRYFDFGKVSKVMVAKETRKALTDEGTRVNCNNKTFSAKDEMSIKFTESDFYTYMLEDCGIKNSKDLIKNNMNRFDKMDINYDEYCFDKILIRQMRTDPNKFVDKETAVCYIFKPVIKSEQYEYSLYVKLNFGRDGAVNVMSLHWNSDGMTKFPEQVWNRKTNQFDSLKTVMNYLEENYKEPNEEKTLDKYNKLIEDFDEKNKFASTEEKEEWIKSKMSVKEYELIQEIIEYEKEKSR